MEAFSDGVLAIILTIMVLELRRPEADTFAAFLQGTGPALLTYLLSFIYVGIYWNNHHHTLQMTDSVKAPAMWANLALLFFLSLLPFATGWMDETSFARVPVIIYGTTLLLSSMAFFILQRVIIHSQGEYSPLRRALGRDRKGKAPALLYALGVLAAALDTTSSGIGVAIALSAYVVVALLWFIPDRRIDRTYHSDASA